MWKDEEDKVYSEEDLFDIALEECHSEESAYNHIDNLIEEKNLEEIKMKTIQEMIKDLTGINVEQNKINDYLEDEELDLRYANLKGADLQFADLRSVNLDFLYLQGTNLKGADLKGADLTTANLDGTKITEQQLQQLTIIEEDE